jgi:threonine dehydrogenase-like Zn-dependent dehydrogenase
MIAIELYRSVPRYLASRTLGARAPGLLAGPIAPLRLVDREPPNPPADGWLRIRPILSGICGSDLKTIAGQSSFYFTAVVSLPFVPGHEVVGEVVDGGEGFDKGDRVVLNPVLSCEPRGIAPACGPCSSGEPGLCERVTGGHVGAGLQTGYCHDTGGGWSEMLVAHRSQLHTVPDDVSNESALMVEPLACAIHAVKRAPVPRDATVLIVGAGTVGLLTLIALKEFAEPSRVIVVAKHQRQANLARRLGAEVTTPREALGSVRRSTRAFRLDPERTNPYLLGGVDVSFECAGSKSAFELALKCTRGRGRVVISGMPDPADLSPAWFRELEIVGAYSGAGCFQEALELAGSELGELVEPAYPLASWRDAIDHALSAGSLGATKIAFDPTIQARTPALSLVRHTGEESSNA